MITPAEATAAHEAFARALPRQTPEQEVVAVQLSLAVHRHMQAMLQDPETDLVVVNRISDFCSRAHHEVLTCTRTDEALRAPAEDAYRALCETIIRRSMHVLRRALGPADHGRDAEIVRARDILRMVSQDMIPFMRAHPDQEMTDKFLIDNFPRYPALVNLLRTTSERVEWSRVRAMLPPELRERFTAGIEEERLGRLQNELCAHTDFFRLMAGKDGFNMLMRSLGLEPRYLPASIKHIPPYLGRYEAASPAGGDPKTAEPTTLEISDRRSLGYYLLRKEVFRRLTAEFGDQLTVAEHQQLFRDLPAHVRRIIDQIFGQRTPAMYEQQRETIEQVIASFERVQQTPLPARLNSTLTVNQNSYGFPSIAQMLGALEFEEPGSRRLMVLPQAKGKSELMFLTKELWGCDRMLLVCPNGMPREIAARVRRDRSVTNVKREPCYKEGQEPNIGIIQSRKKQGITYEDIRRAVLGNEVVIMTYSMAGQKISDGTSDEELSVWQHVVNIAREEQRPFDLLQVDEVQNASDDKKTSDRSYTKCVQNLAAQLSQDCQDLRVGFYSADPLPGGLPDLPAYLAVLDPRRYGNVGPTRARLYQTDPLTIHLALQHYLFSLHGRLNWQRYVHEKEIRLLPEEDRQYAEIFENETMEVGRKYFHLQWQISNPSALHARQVDSMLLEEVTRDVIDALEESNTAIIMLHATNEGMTKPHRFDPQGRFTFTKLLQERVQQALQTGSQTPIEVTCEIIDGNRTKSEAKKQAVLDRVRRVASAPLEDGKKTILFVQRETGYMEGQNYSFADLLGLPQGYTDNMADTGQGVMRLPRGTEEENARKRAFIYLLVRRDGTGTIAKGRKLNSFEKQCVSNVVLHGHDPLSEDETNTPEEIVQSVRSKRGPWRLTDEHRARAIRTPKQMLALRLHRMIDQGAECFEAFLKEHEAEFVEVYTKHYPTTNSATNAKFVEGIYSRVERMFAGTDAAIRIERVLDVGGGPCAQAWASGTGRHMTVVDLSAAMMEAGRRILLEQGFSEHELPQIIQGSMTRLMHLPLGEELFDAINSAFSAYFAKLNVHRTECKMDDEYVGMMASFAQKLRMNGILTETFPKRFCTPEQLQRYCEHALPCFGLQYIPECTGRGRSTDNADHMFENTVITSRKIAEFDPELLERSLNLWDLRMTKPRRHNCADGGARVRLRREACVGVDEPREAHSQFAIEACSDDESLAVYPPPVSHPVRFVSTVNIVERRERAQWRSGIQRFVVLLKNFYAEYGPFEQWPQPIRERVAKRGLQRLEHRTERNDDLWLLVDDQQKRPFAPMSREFSA